MLNIRIHIYKIVCYSSLDNKMKFVFFKRLTVWILSGSKIFRRNVVLNEFRFRRHSRICRYCTITESKALNSFSLTFTVVYVLMNLIDRSCYRNIMQSLVHAIKRTTQEVNITVNIFPMHWSQAHNLFWKV